MPSSEKYKLAAVLFADIAGYTALMQRDEQHALLQLQKFKHELKTNILAHHGEIIEVFRNPLYKNRISIFHYGGHADGYQLLLEGKEGESQVAKGERLVPLLGRGKNLKLVFLNGCSTQRPAPGRMPRMKSKPSI